jgi:hypothetical protein
VRSPIALSSVGDDSEEIGSSGGFGTAVLHNLSMIPTSKLQRFLVLLSVSSGWLAVCQRKLLLSVKLCSLQMCVLTLTSPFRLQSSCCFLRIEGAHLLYAITSLNKESDRSCRLVLAAYRDWCDSASEKSTADRLYMKTFL